MVVKGIVQARMNSTRLPGKVMKEIVGKPLLKHVIERVSASKRMKGIVIATSINPVDDVIEAFARENKIPFFRGSENDVLDRFYQVARVFRIDVIVRITADDPFKDPQIIDKAIEIFESGSFDYVTNTLPPTYPIGLDVEVFSYYALERAWKEAKRPSEREHVTPYIWKHPDKFRIKNFGIKKDLSYLRWTLDDEKDLEFTIEIYKRLYQKKKIFLMKDILALLKDNPAFSKINERKEKFEGYLASLEKDRELGFE